MKPDPETEAEILAVIREFEEAGEKKDVEALMRMTSPDIVGFGTGADERVVGLEQSKAATERDFAQADALPMEWNWTSISVHGDVAIFAAECVIRWRAGGRESSAPARLTTVFEKQGGCWLFLHYHLSFAASDQPVGQSFPTPIEAVASAVSEERPDLRAQAAPDGTVTMLFTDIENSTNLTERLGDAQWLDVLRRHNAIVRGQVKEHGCFEVKSQGDGFMVASQSARRAVHCAIGIQRGLSEYNEVAAEPIQVRMGLHTGEVLRDANDFFGKHVILASRIAGKARGGEILASALLRELTESGGDLRFGEAREVELKGLSGVHLVHEVQWME